MLVRLNRIDLDSETLSKPIPALTERQFVVAKVKRSSEEERLERELFWYREELLRRIKMTWSEVRFSSSSPLLPYRKPTFLSLSLSFPSQIGSLRSGAVSLRDLHLDPLMLDILRGDEVSIELYLADNLASSSAVDGTAESGAGSAFELQGRGQRLLYSAKADEFVDVCAQITNRGRASFFLSDSVPSVADVVLPFSPQPLLSPSPSDSSFALPPPPPSPPLLSPLPPLPPPNP